MPTVATIAREPPRQPGVLELVAQSHALMGSLYPAESNHMLGVAELEALDAAFFVAREHGRAIGCGAWVLTHPGEGELKSMFVTPAARGGGLGRRLLEVIESDARSVGLHVLRLETGVRQPEAIGLYRSAGYQEIGPFGGYLPDPLSLFMEKRLEIGPGG